MDRNAIATSILLFLVIVDVSGASSSFRKLRYLLAHGSASKNNTIAATTTTSPKLPSPNLVSGSDDKRLDPKRDNSTTLDPNWFSKTASVTPPPNDKKDQKPSGKPEKVNPFPQKGIGSENNSSLASNPKTNKTMERNEETKKNVDSGNGAGTEVDKEMEKKKKTTNENDAKSATAETCDGIDSRCEDRNSLTACVKDFGTESKKLVVLVHNRGEKTLNVNLNGPFETAYPMGFQVPKHGTKKIDIAFTVSKPSSLVFTAGNGDCEIPLTPLAISEDNFFSKLQSYEELLTPVNVACFLIVVAVIFGGLGVWCMFKRGRHDDGIAYQELEMGLPESMAGTEVETAEGWDQDWDDDWDDDKAVKSPLARKAASVSAKGLTAKSSNKDGWNDDWDD